MVLNDAEIRRRIDHDALDISPYTANSLQPASYDLHISLAGRPSMALGPAETITVATVEAVVIPDDLCAFIEGKSSLGRLGISVHPGAGFVDPGYRGKLTLTLHNGGDTALALCDGDPVAQLVFMETASAAARPYGSDGLNSHYQGSEGAAASVLEAQGGIAEWSGLKHESLDTWERIEADAHLLQVKYWDCIGVPCAECPSRIEGRRPDEHYGVETCINAQMVELVRRCKALARG